MTIHLFRTFLSGKCPEQIQIENNKISHNFFTNFVTNFLSAIAVYYFIFLKSASNLNDNLNCSKELEHYAS